MRGQRRAARDRRRVGGRVAAVRAARADALPGSKNACEQGECGSCSVYLDGVLVCSCLVAAGQAEGREVVTVEGSRRRGRAAPGAGGVRRGGRGAVRVLHAGPDRRDARPAGAQSRRRRTRRSARRSPATCAAARATRRSSTRSGWRRRDVILEALRRRDGRGRRVPRRARRHRGQPDRRRRPGPLRRRRRPRSTRARLLVTPGLINCHHHLYQWATRGLAQQATLFEWLVELYPVWARIDERVERAAARAGLAALLRSGCTTASDHHYVFPPAR